MKTKLLYMNDSYLKTTTAKVIGIDSDATQVALRLDQTIFYAQGGGQPPDQGKITGQKGTFEVTHVSYNGGELLHKGKLVGDASLLSFQPGDEVQLEIDWTKRYQHMQWHTAGHIVDQAVKNVVANSNSVDGNHGIGKKMYVEFTNPINANTVGEIERAANQIIQQDLPIKIEMVTYQQLVERNIKLPFDLPQNKELRIVQIGEYPEMPDGGTQLKRTGECWPIKITGVVEKEGKWRVVYEVGGKETKSTNFPKVSSLNETSNDHNPYLSFEEFSAGTAAIYKQFQEDKKKLPLFELRTQYFGKNGNATVHVKQLPMLAPDDKKKAGEDFNATSTKMKTEFEELESQQKNSQSSSWVDLTMPGFKPNVGHMHPISQAIEEISGIFQQIGFTRVRYPEVDWDWYAFESLNMPPDHPARDEWETFFVDVPDTTTTKEYDENNPRMRHPDLVGGKIVLTPHTSNGQVREMERQNSEPPMRMINIARCYRRQQDVTHTQMFHQFEGLVVDKGINIQHLKGTLNFFAEKFYGPGTKSRIRPFHFQFTEPSFEVDFSCHICDGTGIKNGEKCRFCKSGWHEVGGAGMVHPNVLKAGGIDPEVYTGFAFGWGVERTYTLKEGLNIDDIRLLYSSDLRFLRQF